jgi:pescadillo
VAAAQVFVSIKGIYFQAEVQGQPITWVIPHQFTQVRRPALPSTADGHMLVSVVVSRADGGSWRGAQVLPPDVDTRIMLTFLEFYETLLKFVLFKLYHSLELKYPPVLDDRLDDLGTYMAAVRGLALDGEGAPKAGEEGAQTAKEMEVAVAPRKEDRKRIRSLEEKLAAMREGGYEGVEEDEDDIPEGALAEPLEKALDDLVMEVRNMSY